MSHMRTMTFDLSPRGDISSAPPRILGRPLSIMSDTDGIDVCDNVRSQRFRPKARKQDVEAYIESCRTKFGCFEGDGSEDDITGEWVGARSRDYHVTTFYFWLGTYELYFMLLSPS